MAFDLRRFAESSEPVKYEDLDFDTFLSQPLDEQTLRSLRYMCDVEYHTSCFLRDLLVTPSHREEDAGGFMTMWNREEFWHGEALAAVLAKHGIIVDYDELKAKRVKLGWGAGPAEAVGDEQPGGLGLRGGAHGVGRRQRALGRGGLPSAGGDDRPSGAVAAAAAHRPAGNPPRGLLHHPGPRAPAGLRG